MSRSPVAATSADITYRPASGGDLLDVGGVYLRAFPDSLRDLRSPELTAQAVADVMRASCVAEPAALTVAEAGGEGERRIVGYVLAPAEAGRTWRAAVARGMLLTWVWRWLTGRYRLSGLGALAVLGDKLAFWRAARLPGSGCGARILSIAVDPAWQGRGVGRRLLEVSVSRLRALGRECVRLEVRPDNVPARRLYESLGFRDAARYQDSRGSWEVMILDLRQGRNA